MTPCLVPHGLLPQVWPTENDQLPLLSGPLLGTVSTTRTEQTLLDGSGLH